MKDVGESKEEWRMKIRRVLLVIVELPFQVIS